jgi:hypothetical protein
MPAVQKAPLGTVIQMQDGSHRIFDGRQFVPAMQDGNRQWKVDTRAIADMGLSAGGGSDIKEFQANAASRATLMDQGERDYDTARQQGYDPSNWRNQFARGIEGSGIGNWFADVVRDKPSERGRAAELQFVDGALRTTTGANAPEPEVVRANKAYFRQPGESEGVEPNKSILRRRFRDQSVRIAGSAYVPYVPPAPPPPKKTQPRPPLSKIFGP